MKKITFLIMALISFMGFSQELLTNGDFQTGSAAPDWYGNAANVVDLGGGNFVNEANVITAGNPWDVNLSQNVALEANKTYVFTFDAFTDTGNTRTMVAGIGENADDFQAVTQTPTLTDTPQTFTYNLTVNYNDVANSRVLFDMGADTGFVFIDNVSLTLDLCSDGILNNGETEIDCGGPNCDPCPSPPTVASPTPPARDPNDVFALYSNAYTEEAFDSFEVFGAATVTPMMADGDDILELDGAPGEGFQYNYFPLPGADLSAFTHYHVDFWVSASVSGGEVITTQILNYDGGGSLESNNFHSAPISATGSWVSVDLELASFTNASGNTNYNNVGLIQYIMQGPAYGPIYLDNMYFHKNTTLSTENFELNEIKAYPNPTQNTWTLSTRSQITDIQLYDVLGKEIMTLNPNALEVTIDASELSNGLYFAKVTSVNGAATIRLVRE